MGAALQPNRRQASSHRDRLRADRCLPQGMAAPVSASAARAAQSRAALAPTFVSGQLFLGDLRANALVHASISRRTNKAAARACHRRYWPETNVGASAARDCAARAALDLTGAEDAPATLARNHRISHRYRRSRFVVSKRVVNQAFEHSRATVMTVTHITIMGTACQQQGTHPNHTAPASDWNFIMRHAPVTPTRNRERTTR